MNWRRLMYWITLPFRLVAAAFLLLCCLPVDGRAGVRANFLEAWKFIKGQPLTGSEEAAYRARRQKGGVA